MRNLMAGSAALLWLTLACAPGYDAADEPSPVAFRVVNAHDGEINVTLKSFAGQNLHFNIAGPDGKAVHIYDPPSDCSLSCTAKEDGYAGCVAGSEDEAYMLQPGAEVSFEWSGQRMTTPESAGFQCFEVTTLEPGRYRIELVALVLDPVCAPEWCDEHGFCQQSLVRAMRVRRDRGLLHGEPPAGWREDPCLGRFRLSDQRAGRDPRRGLVL